MTETRLVLRSASYYWRTNLAVCFGVAAAVAVLGGALLVGDSVRGSLRDIAISRLGRTVYSVSSADYFREALADDVSAAASVGAAPLIAASGFVTHEPSGRRAANVLVYGVDERFWRFHGLATRDGVFVSPALAAELGAGAGDVLLTRLEKPSAIPLESLFAHKEDAARTVRLSVTATLPGEQLGEFSLKPQQAEVRAVLAPLRRLQRDLAVAGKVNTLLIGDDNETGTVQRAFRSAVTLDDLGIGIDVATDKSAAIVESASGVVSEPLEKAILDAGAAIGAAPPMPVFTYLANTIRVRDREIPYSLVSGVDLRVLYRTQPRSPVPARESAPDLGPPLSSPAAIILNDWAARDLGASVDDPLQLEFFLWDPAAGLRTATANFTVTTIVPMTGLAADRRLAPEYPGITGAETLSDWDPPFPLDLSRVRKQDEQYWHDHRATPKAFIDYERARDLWSTRYGTLTGLRFGATPSRTAESLGDALRSQLQKTVAPASLGVALVPSRRLALDASAGATNFGEYFTYFSFFIVFSALLLTVLFFRLGVEQRLRQIGILRASGFTAAHIRRMLLLEAGALAVLGSLVGVAGAIGYAHVIVFGLRTWWVGAVGTSLLNVHISWLSLAIGAVAGMLAAAACVLFSMRAVARRSPRMLLNAHSLEQPAGVEPHRAPRTARLAATGAVLGLSLITLGFVSRGAQVGAFFGAGAALLVSCLMFLSAWLRSRDTRLVSGRGTWAVARLGFRGAAFRPGRSVLSAALVASAAFIIVSVGAFRRGGGELTTDPHSGTGGFVLLAQSDVPLVQNPSEPAGREALGIQSPEFAGARFTRFRIRPGDDASCLNLYRPGNPTIIAPEPSFIDSGRFSFSSSLAQNDQERANPWLLLRRTFEDSAVPVIADGTSLQYVLHESVGDTMSIDIGAERPLTLRFVGALQDSVLQGQLVIGEEQFVKLFPGQQGFRYFLIDAPGVSTTQQAAALAEVVERELQPFGVDAVVTTERLEAFHRVENTYLSTFQALGGLGLILGTIGLATVMFRNVLERRRELALLRAVGYNARHVTAMILAETALLVSSGLVAGAGCAMIAIAPAWFGRGGTAPGAGLVFLIAGVAGTGVLSAIAATRAALSGSVLEALRAE
jgi:ABC-type antimicrobial peptide transport system permease subunit